MGDPHNFHKTQALNKLDIFTNQTLTEALNMETDGSATTLRRTAPPATRRRIVLFPVPFQGHMNPMLQLANILHSQGFKIAIIHTQYNSPNASNYPHFTFKSLSEFAKEFPSDVNVGFVLDYLNKSCIDSFRECLVGLLNEEEDEPVACLITDVMLYFTQGVADALKIPRLVLMTGSLASHLVVPLFPLFIEKGYYDVTKEDPNYDARVPEYPHLKLKDIRKITNYPKSLVDLIANMRNQIKASSGIIWNSCKELEESSLETIFQDYPNPSFTFGPFHKYFSTSSSSFIEEDRSILSWLDSQAPKSVIYVSFGSLAQITDLEFREVAHGLANTGLPFLWVVRPGMVTDSIWLEYLPEKFLESVGDKGRIVKWTPQQEVLAHQATGCFWTHSGWNSTTESICEGVPMICSPCYADQPINARYVSDIWKIGVVLEDGFERAGIELMIKRVMMDQEGEDIRKRINCLKEKVNLSLKEGGSSHQSLKSLVNCISSF